MDVYTLGLLIGVLIAPFLLAGSLAWAAIPSLKSLLMVLLGSLGGGVLFPLAGTALFILIYSTAAEGSQALGLVFLPLLAVWLVFSVYTGAIAGGGVIAFGYRQQRRGRPGTSTQWLVAAVLALVLMHIIPLALLAVGTLLYGVVVLALTGGDITAAPPQQLDEGVILLLILVCSVSGFLSAYGSVALAWLGVRSPR